MTLNNLFSSVLVFLFFFSNIHLLTAQSVPEDYLYISPRDGANYISIHNNILIRYGEKLTGDPSEFADLLTLTGSKSGEHSVRSLLADDGETIIFLPNTPFEKNETVSVKFSGGIETVSGEVLPPLEFDFSTSKKSVDQYTLYKKRSIYANQNLKSERYSHLQSRQLDTLSLFGPDSIPNDYVTYRFTELNTSLPGYILITPFKLTSTFGVEFTYVTIIDNYGVPIFYKKIPNFGIDAQVQSNGLLTHFNEGLNAYIGLNNKYEVVDTFYCGNGYPTDFHELLLRENGNALLISVDDQPIAMDTVVEGGHPEAIVRGTIIQEIDEDHNVVFQWRSWDHFQITDAEYVNMQDSVVDYAHPNAIEVDLDGNLLTSSRHMSEITKIDRNTGDIIWRMGGKKNQVEFINDNRQFSYQHHIRVLDNGNYTLFDNGNFLDPQYSSVLEYEVDEDNLTAELVWSYNDGETYGGFMGNAQRLPNGNTMIGWGGTHPSLTEISSDGEKLLEIHFDEDYLSYRAFRYDWEQNVFSNNIDTLNFLTDSETTDTAYVEITNNLFHDLTITTAVTRTEVFTIENELPFELASGETKSVGVISNPTDSDNVEDVLTLRADSDTLGYGVQIYLNSNNPTSVEDEEVLKNYSLSQNYPNPFNPTTQIDFTIPRSGQVTLTVYDVLGRKVAELVNEYKTAGSHTVKFNANDFSTGIYFYKLTTANYSNVKKMLLLK